MNAYIGLIMVSTLMFSVQFWCNSMYQKAEGHSFCCSAVFSFLNAAFGFVMLFAINRFKFEFSLFSAALSVISALKNILFAYFSIKVFKHANLSVYSMFSMLGGMLLPFAYALVFGGEQLTWVKGLCASLIVGALIIGTAGLSRNASTKKNGKLAYLYYFGVFVLNGLSGVFAKVHQMHPKAVTSESYSMLERIFMMLICAVVIAVFAAKKTKVRLAKPKYSLPAVIGAAAMNAFGNLILLKALFHVDASVQYPIVTGGVIVVSMIIDSISGKKPTRYSVVSTAVAFAGLLLLVI